MEVVSYGHIKTKSEFCSGCGATLRYVPRDVQTWKPGTPRAKNFIRCPVCSSIIYVDVTFAKNDRYMTFAGIDKTEDNEDVVKVKDLPFMKADLQTLTHNEVHDSYHVAWQCGYLACLKAAQKQVREAVGIGQEEVE